jgi:glucose-1-phosphatase
LRPSIADVFGKNVFASALFNAVKPSAQTFLRCVDSLNTLPAETLFVDDLESNVVGAQQAKLLGHVFTGHQRLADEFHKHGLLIH